MPGTYKPHLPPSKLDTIDRRLVSLHASVRAYVKTGEINPHSLPHHCMVQMDELLDTRLELMRQGVGS